MQLVCLDFTSEIVYIHIVKLQSKVFSEISVDSAVAAVLITAGWHFYIQGKKPLKAGKMFSLYSRLDLIRV